MPTEPNPSARQLADVGGGVGIRVIDLSIVPSDIVHEDGHDVWLRGCRQGRAVVVLKRKPVRCIVQVSASTCWQERRPLLARHSSDFADALCGSINRYRYLGLNRRRPVFQSREFSYLYHTRRSSMPDPVVYNPRVLDLDLDMVAHLVTPMNCSHKT